MTVPVEFNDLTDVVRSYDADTLAAGVQRGGDVVVYATSAVVHPLDPAHPRPRLTGALRDSQGRTLSFACPDSAQALVRYLRGREGRPILLAGRLISRGETWLLTAPEPVAGKWLGKMRPVYAVPQKTYEAQINRVDDSESGSYLASARVQNVYRENVLGKLRRNIPRCVEAIITKGLKTNGGLRAALGHEHAARPHQRLAQLLTDMHFPQSAAHAQEASERLDHVAAVCMLLDSMERAAASRQQLLERRYKPCGLAPEAAQMGYLPYARLMAQVLPFGLTAEQLDAVASALEAIDSGVPMRAMLIGDVGSGKTAVFGVIVRALLFGGARVAVLLPGITLARQVHRNLAGWLPEFTTAFIAGDSAPPDHTAQLCVGTTKMLSQTSRGFQAVLVDEQQKFSRNRREALMGDRAHLLEITATCIPRSQALVESGQIHVLRLQQCHVNKDIRSRIHAQNEWSVVLEAIDRTIAAGGQVAVIFPARDATSVRRSSGIDTVDVSLLSLMDNAEFWMSRYPGLVRMCHGARTDEENDQALCDMMSGTAKVLLSTTMIEVGVDLPGLRHILIMQPDRFGLSQLHQLRGRVARAGGVGYCDLYLPVEVNKKVRARLEYFCDTFDGFALASFDLANRGGGDITSSGHKQSGTLPNNPFPDREVSVQALEKASAALQAEYFGSECASTFRIAGPNPAARQLTRGIPNDTAD